MKRPNGTGSIVKLPGNRRKPWAVKITLWNEDKTHRKRKIIGTFSTKKEAQFFANSHYDLGEFYSNKKTQKSTLLECAKEALERQEKSLDEDSVEAYNVALKRLKPLWHVRMVDLSGERYQQFVDDLIAQGKKAKYIQQAHLVANKAVKVAVRKGILQTNPIAGTDFSGASHKPDRIRTPFSHAEIETLWKQDNVMARNILLMIYTGLRIEEFCDVRKKDVDLEQRTITIPKSKTQAGIRTVPIAVFLMPLIEFDGNVLACYQNKKTFRKHFKTYLESLGMNHVPHETRHTFITLLDEARLPDGHRIDISVIKVLCGHRVSDITKGIYTHENFSRLVEAVNSLCPTCVPRIPFISN